MKKFNIRPLVVLAILVIVVAGMRAIAPVLNLFLVALLLAVSLDPLLGLLLKRGWSKSLSLTVIIMILVIIAVFLTIILGVGISEMSDKVPFYQERVSEVYQEGLESLATKGINIEDIENLEVFTPEKLFNLSTSFLGGIFSTFGNSVFVVLLTVFILIEFANIRIKASQGGKSEDKLINRFSGLGADLRKYISITALSGFFGAIGQLILMLILGVDFPVMWAFLSFLFNFIPNIGFFLTLIGPAILALLELGWISCLILIVGFVIINGLFDNVIKPKFVGKEFNMSILTVFLSLLFWSWVLGAIGAIMSVPLTITVKRVWEVLNENENDSDEPFKPPED